MAELQTIAAVFDLLKLAWAAGVFLRKVKNADGVANEVYDRVDKLSSVLEGVRVVLQRRHEHLEKSSTTRSDAVEGRICNSVIACHSLLNDLQSKVGGFDTETGSTPTLVARFKVAFRNSSIARRQTDLDARISILQTELVVLQLHDQDSGQASLGANHSELLSGLLQLSNQVVKGNELLQRMVQEHDSAEHGRNTETKGYDDTAVSQLADCLRTAEDAREHYTSTYAPDDRSERFRIAEFPEQSTNAPQGLAGPASKPASPSRDSSIAWDLADADEVLCDDEEDIWPLEILDMYIVGYRSHAGREQLAEHFNQAEIHLGHAIHYSQVREEHYHVPFTEKLQLEEGLAFLYQKQGKFAEAVGKVNQLLRESSSADMERSDHRVQTELAQARLHQLLSAIYFDRHSHGQGQALSNAINDIENAEKHAKRAFKKRFKILKLPGTSPEEAERHASCIELLARILNESGKSVEAGQLSKLLHSDSSSVTSDSIRRVSTAISRSVPDYDMVEDKHGLLVDAIRSGETDQIQALLAFQDIDLERCCQEDKTPLMHAVAQSDEVTLRQLLDPDVGADVNTANRRGLTALHLAAQQGNHAMVIRLIQHDGELDVKDRRGQTPLVEAVKGSHETIIRILSDRGADMMTKNGEEWSLLHHAVHQPDASIVKLVLDIEPDLKDAMDQAGKSALHYCAELELVEHAKVLLNKLDVNAVDSESRTPLYFAATKPSTAKRENMVRMLIAKGAELDRLNLPPRFRDYESLRPFLNPRDGSSRSRRDSASTQGTSSTTGTTATRLSRLFSSRMRGR
ncbi:hypothetical protein LTR08_001560 [Meristemomyces frigidus]|nr:hypothetical protein LTR08_001560 [Meristemomyces frigidus]